MQIKGCCCYWRRNLKALIWFLKTLAQSVMTNLTFISKVAEKTVLQQLLDHCENHAPLPKFQTGFLKFHSTETALLKVQNDILWHMDNKEVTLLVLLDLSVAFDTLEHSILLNVLKRNFWVSSTALKLFDSILSDRKQRVLISCKASDDFSIVDYLKAAVWGMFFLLSTVFSVFRPWSYRWHPALLLQSTYVLGISSWGYQSAGELYRWSALLVYIELLND